MDTKVICSVFLFVYSLNSYAQVANERALFRKVTLLEGSVSLSADTSVRTPLVIESHIISGGARVPLDVPVKGFWLIQAVAGEFKTIDNGNEREYNNGDLWVTTSATDLVVQTEDDAAILQVYAIGEDYLKKHKDIPIGKVVQPSNAPYKLLVKNAFAKESYVIGNPENPVIKVMDVNVGPGLKTDMLRFQGPAAVQVLTGNGVLTVEERPIESPLGTTLAIDPGNSFVIENQSPSPLKLRVVIFQK